MNKLKYFKPVTVDRKVVQGEFIPIKTTGEPPCPRFGHTMSYLPVNSSIIVAGGRNDSLCGVNVTPLLKDIFLFLLDQKVWIRVKHSFNSDNFDYVGNHSMSVICDDNNTNEKIIIFGGIQNQVEAAQSDESSVAQDTSISGGQVKSYLSNKCYCVSIYQRSQGKSFFG